MLRRYCWFRHLRASEFFAGAEVDEWSISLHRQFLSDQTVLVGGHSLLPILLQDSG